jgi:hypothetical protein
MKGLPHFSHLSITSNNQDCIVFDIDVGLIVDNQYTRGQIAIYQYLRHLEEELKNIEIHIGYQKILDTATIF